MAAGARWPRRAANARWIALSAALLPAGIAHADSWSIAPRIGLSETYSTNMTLTSGPTLKGWITDIAPGIQIEGNGARMKVRLDYANHILRYAGSPELSQNLNFLTSNVNIDAIDKWLYLDAGASISQRNRSPFQAAPIAATSGTQNLTETSAAQLSPYIKGVFPELALYHLRYSLIDARSDDAAFAHTRVNQWTGTLRNPSATTVGWSLDFSTTGVRNDVIGDKSDDRVRAGLNLEALPTLHLSASAGQERSDYTSAGMRRTATPGWGLDWTPTPHTQLAVLREKRFFGTAHSALFNHRTALTNWRYTDTRDVAFLAGLLGASAQSAVAELMSDLLAASIPDPVARTAAVRSRLDQDDARSMLSVENDVQTSRLFINHAREASAALIGPRDSLTFSIAQRDQQAIGLAPGVVDSFSLSNDIRERSGRLAWIHRLTPLATLRLSTARLRSEGKDVPDLRSDQWSQTVSITFHPAASTFISFGLRTTRFESTLDGGFRENAAALSFTQRF